MHEIYGIDVSSSEVLDERTWRWLGARVTGLFERPCHSRVGRALGRS